ncbi:hypothetical protein [Paenarthrobacter sp. NPDC057981]|uniref:hypothetical protein n=1 Tax=Paenarthrobacter sp. NPDC057981 TaxID=3346297 RepID=UPI0036DD3CCD
MDAIPLRTLDLTVEPGQDLNGLLDAAVQQLMTAAIAEKAGIQVVRSAVGTYTASVSAEVPFGTTMESWEPPQTAAAPLAHFTP